MTAAATAPPAVGWTAGAWPFLPTNLTDRGRAALTVLGEWLRREAEVR